MTATFATLLKDRALALTTAEDPPTVSLFTKHFQGLGFEELADAVLASGLKAVDAPIREGGHIEPMHVEEDLPKLVETLRARNISMELITTSLTEVSAAQHTEKLLRTAHHLGIRHYRMGYLRYDLAKPIWAQIESWKTRLAELIALSSAIGIQPLYQNHSGKAYFGAPVWDAYGVMRDYPTGQFAFAFDLMHAMIEGGKSWPLEIALVHNHIGALYFKNFQWNQGKFDPCPLDEGVMNREHVQSIKKTGWRGPISLHIEYLKGNVSQPGYLESAIKATRRDAATLKSWWS